MNARSLRRGLSTAALLGAAVAALANQLPPGHGTQTPSGSTFTTEIGNPATGVNDCDDYVFEGVPGTKLSVVVKAAKSSGLVPGVALQRPAGGYVTVAEGLALKEKGASVKLGFTLDETGIWKVQVRAKAVDDDDDDTTPAVRTAGAYSITVRYTAPGATKVSDLARDANGQYRFVVPASGGAQVSFTLSFRGAAPTFAGVTSPSGASVDGVAARVVTTGTKVSLKKFPLPGDLPLGDYAVSFDPGADTSQVSVSYVVKRPKGAKARKARLDANEPVLGAVTPAIGGQGSSVTISVDRMLDDNAKDPGAVAAFIGGRPLENLALIANGRTITGKVPRLPEGFHDVSVVTATGQVAARADAFEVVPGPRLLGIDPAVGTSGGGFDITLTGTGFRPGNLTMGVIFTPDLTVSPLEEKPFPIRNDASFTSTSMTFTIPPGSGLSTGIWYIAVINKQTNQVSPNVLQFEFLSTAGISRLTPSLVPVLGGDTVFVKGTNFQPTDRVFLETAVEGVYVDVGATYISSKLFQFTTPARASGGYDVYVRDQNGFETPHRVLSYFTYADFTPQLGLTATATERFDAWSNFLADYDLDGDEDLFLSRRGGASLATASLTRVLRNDGTGRLTDVTTSVFPAPVSDDDWRADRVWVADVTQDGYPEVLVVTNFTTTDPDDPQELGTFLPGKSHVRILANEKRTTQAVATDRVFRDRTSTLMAPVRIMKTYGFFGGNGQNYVSDEWRGEDMWVGDVDASAAGPPEILITQNEVRDDSNPTSDNYASGVYCGNYCGYQPFPYAYALYWGGSRAFVWDKAARGGAGRYRFEFNFFPRKAGPWVAQIGPGGIRINPCNTQNSCRGKFTPFMGQHITAGTIDEDGKPDVAVLSNGVVKREGSDISSLQVALNRFNSVDGADITDVTDQIGALGGDTKGDALAIGQPGFPDGNGLGVIAIAKASPAGVTGSALRLVRYKAPSVAGQPGTFEEITNAALPPPTAADKWQASQIRFLDLDTDGDQDLVLLANAAPGGTEPAFRILRNEIVDSQVGIFRETLRGLIAPLVTPSEHFEGQALSIGDLDGDEALDFVMSRATPVGTGPQTRAITTDK